MNIVDELTKVIVDAESSGTQSIRGQMQAIIDSGLLAPRPEVLLQTMAERDEARAKLDAIREYRDDLRSYVEEDHGFVHDKAYVRAFEVVARQLDVILAGDDQ